MSLIGKKGYKKIGPAAQKVGTIQEGDWWMSSYKIVFPDGSSVGARRSDIVVLDEQEKSMNQA